ncbi:hypothetical protein BGZ50_003979 [Haplosporangium sp. Z 11]|nr:hypothetical protein BGZ50_003979 [Haplosporangium sp. Z 11]
MDDKISFDEWSKKIHAVVTFLKPFFNDWRSYVNLVSIFLGIGVLIMKNQILLRMRMGRWEIVGYVVWCLISSILGPIFDIVVMLGLFLYCRHKSNRMHITNESIAKALLPAPVARNYRIMGGVCIAASFLTLTSNVLYMLRGWREPSQYYTWASDGVRWLTSQIWYAIGMIFLFHVVTRPAQSGVVLFGKVPRDLWAYKWCILILFIPVHYMLLKLCDTYRDTKILIPLEILVDIFLYNGPFLLMLLRLLYLAWKVAYDEAILTGAIFEDEEGDERTGGNRRAASIVRPGADGYVGLAMVDLDENEHSQDTNHYNGDIGRLSPTATAAKSMNTNTTEELQDVYVLEDENDTPISTIPLRSPSRSPAPVSRSSAMTAADSPNENTVDKLNRSGLHAAEGRFV